MPTTFELPASAIADSHRIERLIGGNANMLSRTLLLYVRVAQSETSTREMTMSIRHSAAAIAVATAILGSGFRIAAAGNRTLSRTVVSACEGTSTATSKGSRSDDAVREGEAVVTELDVNASAITYWVSGSDGWHVVTTVDIRLEDNHTRKLAVVRFSAVLLPGQSQRISIPVALGERQQVLCIRRLGNRLEVARVFGPSV